MRLRKAITAKSFDLIEQPVCKVRGVALAEHALLELVLEGEELAVLAPVADRAPQGVGFSSREPSSHHSQANHLFLEYRHPQCPRQDRFNVLVGVADGLQPGFAAQVGVHHIALNRAGPNDGDLDHQVIKTGGFQSRQHRHLCARLDLKDTQRIGFLQHSVGGGIFFGDILYAANIRAIPADHVEAFADG